MLKRLMILAAAGLFGGACSDVGLTEAGMTLEVTVDTGRVTGRLAEEDKLRIAAWVGQVPVDGLRPDAVLHVDESSEVGRTCDRIPDQEYLRCDLNLVLDPNARLYVGVFYERAFAADVVPAPGELLSYTGPVSFDTSQSPAAQVEVEVVDPEALDLPAFPDVLERLRKTVEEPADAAAFVANLHPFYGDPWALKFTDMADWVTGGYAVAGTTFADPLSAPAAGFLSADVRSELDVSDLAIEELEQQANSRDNLYTAQWEVAYQVKENSISPNRFPIVEVWDLRFRATTTDILLIRNWVRSQSIDNLEVSGEYSGQVIQVDWGGSRQGEDGYRVALDRFDPETQLWSFVDRVDVTPGIRDCGIANGSTCLDLTNDLDDTAFYRVRVADIDNAGNVGAASTIYLPGPNYPY